MRLNFTQITTAAGDSATAAAIGIAPNSTNSKIYLCTIAASYSDSTVPTKAMTIVDGGTTRGTIHVGGARPRDITFNPPVEMHDSATISLPASGVASAVGAVTLGYFTL